MPTIWSADAVFEATVTAIEPHAGAVLDGDAPVQMRERLISLKEAKSWIGEAADTVITDGVRPHVRSAVAA